MLLIALCQFVSVVTGIGTQVTFAGTTFTGVDQGNGVSAWLGMPYAQPPTGNLRWRAPQDWRGNAGDYSARSAKSICLATGNGYTAGGTNPSEDCLYVGVWAPTTASVRSRLPVYVFFQGGGFNANSHPNINGTTLVRASGNNIIMVTLNYRVGLWGFLASQQVQANGNTNVGLLDQRKALEWVKKYIVYFGGDPDHITIGGASAGGASVYYHLTAYGGRDDRLFHAAAGESPSYGAQLTVSEAQYQYDQLLSRTGCNNLADSLACLRGLNVATLQRQSTAIPYPGRTGPPLYMWSPVIDGDFVRDYTYRAFEEGDYVKVPTIFGATTDDGTDFAPPGTNSVAAMNDFLSNNYPKLTAEMLATINADYPQGQIYASKGAYWPPTAKVYGEMRYRCPGMFMSDMQSRYGVDAWNYRWNVPCPQCLSNGNGVTHTIETNVLFGTNDPYPGNYYPNSPFVLAMLGYWTSFIRSKDPNTYRAYGTPEWEQWQPWEPQIIVFNPNTNVMEDRAQDITTRCAHLQAIGVSIQQ